MRVSQNPDKAYTWEVIKKIRENGGYCPCSLVKTPETKCMCKEFLESEEGMCQCGLYIKEREAIN